MELYNISYIILVLSSVLLLACLYYIYIHVANEWKHIVIKKTKHLRKKRKTRWNKIQDKNEKKRTCGNDHKLEKKVYITIRIIL